MKSTSLFLTIVASLALPACTAEAKEEPGKVPAKGAPVDPNASGITTADLVLSRIP